MVTHLDHRYEAPRWQSHGTRTRAPANPFVSKSDFLLIIISCVELLRTAYVSHYGLWGCGAVGLWGGCKMASNQSEPVSTCCCCTFGRPRACAQAAEVKEEQGGDDNSSVLSAAAGASLAPNRPHLHPLNELPAPPRQDGAVLIKRGRRLQPSSLRCN